MNRQELSRGFYMKPLIDYGNWGRQWKIDIWSLPGRMVDKKMAELQDLKACMTREQKKLILDYKYSILTDQGRTPMFSGIFIYRAVINCGMTGFDDITKYLRKHGIKI